MKKLWTLVKKWLYPPKWILLLVPVLSFGLLILVFVSGSTECAPAYGVYGMAAYSLTIWIASLPPLVRRLQTAVERSRPVQAVRRSALGERYGSDGAFRRIVRMCPGMTANLLYAVFRLAAGALYRSVWFLSMGVYYLVLGGLRVYLFIGYRRHSPSSERRCYRRTAWLLFLLNIPMGGMIWLMVRTDAGYSYPGSLLYLSALYTFYSMTVSVIGVVRLRGADSPIVSAVQVLNAVAAMMSVLGLQTAMMAQFSAEDALYRRRMNTITGSFLYGIVLCVALYMLWHSRKRKERTDSHE